MPGAGAQDLPRLRPGARDRDRQGRGHPGFRGREHLAARLRIHDHHSRGGRVAPGRDRGSAAPRRRAAGADRGRDLRHGRHHEARAGGGARAPARGRQDRRLLPHRRLQAGLLRPRKRELHHPPLGPRGDRGWGDRDAARLRGEVAGTRGVKDRLLDALRTSRADYTEIRVERTWGSSVTYRGRRLESATATEDQGGFVRALHRGYGWGVASFTSLERLPAMVARATELSRAIRVEDPIRLADVPPHEADALLDLDGDVRGVPLAEKKRLIEAYNGEMLAVSDRVVDTLASYRDEVTEYWFVSSAGAMLHELRPEVTLSGTAVARRNGTIEKGLESIGLRRGWTGAQSRSAGFRAAAERAVALLDAPGVKGGRYPVVLDPELAGVFIHEAFGHLSEADFIYENPQAREMMTLGRRFGRPVLNVGDNGAEPGLRGTLPFDDEGTPTQDTPLIREGVLVGRLHSRETAARLGERPTGNARALSFRHAPIVRMTNTYIGNGRGTFEDLIRDIKLGVYACGAFGGQTLLENFSFTAAYGRMIRDGHQAELVKDVVLAGNLFQTLDRIERIAGDFRWNQMGGGCGKAGQGPLPVTEGAPHVRIEEALIGGDVPA
ncbi:MAG: TldD/PmbA family protein [Gemmatimonadetes bacterium]|nr:MAG: TldD/PmbA family protein [Gemmatimonadota bacterium]